MKMVKSLREKSWIGGETGLIEGAGLGINKDTGVIEGTGLDIEGSGLI